MLSERLQLAMKEAGVSQAELARACGVKPPSVHGWLSGKSKFLRGENLLAAARALNVSQEWLATGKGPMRLELGGEEGPGSQSDEDVVRQPTDDEFALVPQLNISAACGEGRFVDHVVVKGGLAFKRSSLKDFGVPEAAARIIYASGGSMWPEIKDGCVVLLNTADATPADGNVYAICMPDGSLVLKRLVNEYSPGIGANVWIMRSTNPDKNAYPDKLLPPDDRTTIIGRAVWNDNRL
ncbi:LexA family transcriptional regulator [Ralstonia syzygii]|uniref:LexA family transcriptional regulator n=1 Tax=Ralstonia syzygii TaxID=28097 RepID=UPI0018D0CDF6|nr:S24 family peptidase [Ralstonia syzygii]